MNPKIRAIYHLMLSEKWLIYSSDHGYVVWTMDNEAAHEILTKIKFLDSHDRVRISQTIIKDLKEEKSNEVG